MASIIDTTEEDAAQIPAMIMRLTSVHETEAKYAWRACCRAARGKEVLSSGYAAESGSHMGFMSGWLQKPSACQSWSATVSELVGRPGWGVGGTESSGYRSQKRAGAHHGTCGLCCDHRSRGGLRDCERSCKGS